MERLNDDSLRIIQVMKAQMRFDITTNDILINAVPYSTDIHIRIDTNRMDYYHDYFHSINRHMQLLIGLGDSAGAAYILEQLKLNLEQTIEDTVRCRNKVVLHFPALEQCLSDGINNHFIEDSFSSGD